MNNLPFGFSSLLKSGNPPTATASPPDVLAYLEEATTTIAQEQNFSPANKEELANWLKLNLAKIVVKAKELQFNCWVKFVSNQEAHDLVSETITKQVWNYHNSTDSTILKTLS